MPNVCGCDSACQPDRTDCTALYLSTTNIASRSTPIPLIIIIYLFIFSLFISPSLCSLEGAPFNTRFSFSLSVDLVNLRIYLSRTQKIVHTRNMSTPAAQPKSFRAEHPSPPPTNTGGFDFHTVTCVAWTASGRNIGVGTPDGFLVFSTEPLVATLGGSSAGPSMPAKSTNAADAWEAGALQEVCRCAVYGGVGLLGLYKQCSVVAFTGVQRRTASTRVQLADVSRSPPSTYFTTTARTEGAKATQARSSRDGSTPLLGAVRPWPAEEDAAVAEWFEQWRTSAFANAQEPSSSVAATLAYVECPSAVAALHFCPHVVIAASSGDPRIAGSHTLSVFDHHLRPLYTLPVYPPSSNAYLTDMIAIAAAFTSLNGAGMVVQRLRVLLPGEKKGEVRLLTLKRSLLTATAYDGPAGPGAGLAASSSKTGESQHRLVDRVLHQAPLRAVAITEDGRSGVTMSEQGMRIRLLDFVGDDIISERLSLDRGRLPAVTDSVALAILSVPQPGGPGRAATTGGGRHERCGSESGGVAAAAYAELPNRQYQQLTEALHDLVVCLTSSGTIHFFGCGQQQVLFYHSDKTLLPRVGYPYAFSLCLPSQLAKESTATLFVARSDAGTSAARYLPRREHEATQEKRRSTARAVRPGELLTESLPGDLFAFQLRYPASLSARDAQNGSGVSGDGPRSTLFARCSFTS